MSVLVMHVSVNTSDFGDFLWWAVVPAENQTPEFLRLCDLLDGKMPGEDGDTVAETKDICEASEDLDKMCGGFGGDGSTVRLPPGTVVARVVTIGHG